MKQNICEITDVSMVWNKEHSHHFCYWFCPSTPLSFFEYIVYEHLMYSVSRRRHLHLIKPDIFFENQEKLWKLLVFTVFVRIYSVSLACLFLQGILFPMYRENGYFNNKRTSIFDDMALHFSQFHHHIELFDYLLHLISGQIQRCNFCSMHCSFDKRNYI